MNEHERDDNPGITALLDMVLFQVRVWRFFWWLNPRNWWGRGED